MTVGIYKIQNIENGKTYVGQSVDIERRWKQHINNSLNENSSEANSELHRSIRKNSFEMFSWEILEECKIEELNDKEQFWIKTLNCITPYGYNYTYGGQNNGSGSFIKLNDESLNAIVQDLVDSDLTVKQIATKYQLSHQMVYDIKNGKSWKKDGIIYPLRKNLYQESCCEYCGQKKTREADMCKSCYDIFQQTVERPDPVDLMEMIFNEGFAAIGRKYGVSDNSIRKWCEKYGLPSKIKEVKEWWIKYSGLIIKEKRKISNGSILQIDKDTKEIIATYPSAIAAAEALGNREYNKHISSVCSGSRKTAYGYVWKRITE